MPHALKHKMPNHKKRAKRNRHESYDSIMRKKKHKRKDEKKSSPFEDVAGKKKKNERKGKKDAMLYSVKRHLMQILRRKEDENGSQTAAGHERSPVCLGW